MDWPLKPLRNRAWLALALLIPIAFAACSSDGTPEPLGLPSSAELDNLPPPPPNGTQVVVFDSTVEGGPTEVYTRIARGALNCWFGATGPLKGKYVYHANADPPSKGGRSDIVIFGKDAAASDPRAIRAFRILISKTDATTRVEAENIKLDEPLAARLRDDAGRWSGGTEGCSTAPITAGWQNAQPAAKAGPEKKKKNKK